MILGMSMIRKMCFIAVGFFLSFKVFASSFLPISSLFANPDNLDNRWSIIASLGYGEYQHMYRADGQTVLGRLALAAEMLAASQATFGLEIGLQSGNRMRFAIPQGTFDTLGGAVRTTMRPMLDLLVTAYMNPLSESLLFTQVKGGIAYRHWQIDSNWINNKSEFAGEVQAGLGYPLTEISNLNLLYQGVFGGNPKLHANLFNEPRMISSLPMQHGVLLGFSIIA
jgi:hypothetical protein